MCKLNRHLQSLRRFMKALTLLFLIYREGLATDLKVENNHKKSNLQVSTNAIGFEALDTDHDGYIDRNEYATAIIRFQSSLLNGFDTAGTKLLEKPIFTTEKSIFSGFSIPTFLKSDGSDELSFWPAFVNSLSMIIATEIGDKTFFIAAVLSMKNDRLAVFGGAIAALAVMTLLSSVMGLVLPSFLPRKYTHIIGGLLFLYFGVKLFIESQSMDGGKCSDELEEVEEELLQQSSKKDDIIVEDSLEIGLHDGKIKKQPTNPAKETSSGKNVFLQALTMTFLAEWGDRSQIATIALAASKDPLGVNVGGVLGHSLCTGMAVIGGRMLATKIEEKTVTRYSGIIFLGFGLHSLFFESA